MEFGDVTIARYLAGQTPSKAKSDKLLEVSASASKMEEYLLKAQKTISDVAFRKCKQTVDIFKSLFIT